jgi:hypothetical protein
MLGKNVNFQSFAGDSYWVRYDLFEADNVTPYEIDPGATAKFVLKRGVADPQNAIIKQSPAIIIAENKVTVYLSPADTLDLSGQYYHECELTENGEVFTIGFGNANFLLTGV